MVKLILIAVNSHNPVVKYTFCLDKNPPYLAIADLVGKMGRI